MADILKIEGRLDKAAQSSLFALYAAIFQAKPSEKMRKKLAEKEDLTLWVILSPENAAWIACKLGYRDDDGAYYSWMGGVAPEWRGRGYGRALMEAQHQWCREKGYIRVRTKTLNRWRNMLILNIKCGFDITALEQTERGEVKIVLEKSLV